MFKRRNAIIAFLLVAVMLLGIGYAGLVDKLQITAGVTAAEIADTPTEPGITNPSNPSTPQDIFDSKVGFTACTKDDANTTDYLTVNAIEGTFDLTDAVSFSASGFAAKGDKVVIIYTVSNEHADLIAELSNPTVSPNNNTYFTATAVAAATEIAAGASTTITVTVEMTKTPIETLDTVDFTLTYNVEAK